MLYEICQKVRQAAEKHYLQHYRQSLKDGLDGYCALSSVALHQALNKANIPTTFAHSKNPDIKTFHVYLLYDDDIVDITADQFGEPPIVITKRSLEHGWYWKPEFILNDIAHIKEYLCYWPESQNPNHRQIDYEEE